MTICVHHGNEPIALMVHLHPEEIVEAGDWLRFKVLPDFVAVMRDTPAEMLDRCEVIR